MYILDHIPTLHNERLLQVELAFLAGLGFALLLIPINRWIAQKIGTYSTEMMFYKDHRIKTVSEMLYGVRIVKFCSWESNFRQKINRYRRDEVKYLKGRKYLDALCVYLWASAPVVVAILTFTTYILMGHRLTAAKVYTQFTILNLNLNLILITRFSPVWHCSIF